MTAILICKLSNEKVVKLKLQAMDKTHLKVVNMPIRPIKTI